MTGAERAMREPAIELRDVSFSYPDGQQALEALSLRIEAGERVAVLGPNGAGKSTLCLHLNGILRPGSGTVRVCGLPTDSRDLREVRRRVGLVFQDPDDQLFLPTVRQDVAFGPANLGCSPGEVQDRVERALAMVGMEGVEERPPHHLSFGQRKRVAIATVLAMEPEVLVLDEPSSNLDPRARRELAEFLHRLDLTMLLVTHDLPYAAQVCERAVVVAGGSIVADGPIGDILVDDRLLAKHALELPAGFNLGSMLECQRP